MKPVAIALWDTFGAMTFATAPVTRVAVKKLARKMCPISYHSAFPKLSVTVLIL